MAKWAKKYEIKIEIEFENVSDQVELRKSDCVNQIVTEGNASVSDGVEVNERMADVLLLLYL